MQSKRSNSPIIRLIIGVLMGTFVTAASIIGVVIMVPLAITRTVAANIRRLFNNDTP